MTASEGWQSETLVTDAIGQLMEFWGFKRNMGRVWAMLYLCDAPLSSTDLQTHLQISSGAVSMTTTELIQWGVVRKVWEPGERKDFFVAESNLWKMVSHVLAERELRLIAQTIESLEEALDGLRERISESDGEPRANARRKRDRVVKLLQLAKLGHRMISKLVTEGSIDAGPLSRVILGADS